MRFPCVKGLVLAAVVVMSASANPGKSHANPTGCGAFPEVSWWVGLNHDMVRRIVARRYGGDWDTYIERWNKQAATLKSISKSGRAAVIKRIGLTLSGGVLETYIGQIEERLAVTRCLAEETLTASFADFATAAGGVEASVKELTIDDGVAADKVQMEIRFYCEPGRSVFQVWNKGRRWPKTLDSHVKCNT